MIRDKGEDIEQVWREVIWGSTPRKSDETEEKSGMRSSKSEPTTALISISRE